MDNRLVDMPIETFIRMAGTMTIAEMAEQMKEIKGMLDEAARIKTALQTKFDALRIDIVPEAMESMGIESTNITGVGRLSVTADMRVSIPSGGNEEALKWLRDSGFGDLIKPGVNSSTLKAFVKEQIKKGNPIPEKLFNIYPFMRATITKQPTKRG